MLADHRAARTRGGGGDHAHEAAQAGLQRREALPHGGLGVAARAQVLRVEQVALEVYEHEVGAGGAHVNAERARHEAGGVALPLAAWQRLEAQAAVELLGRQRLQAGQARGGGGEPGGVSCGFGPQLCG